MGSFADDHAGAHESVAEAGAAVTCTLRTLTSTDTGHARAGASSSVAGVAMGLDADVDEIAALGLASLASVRKLMFVPDTYGSRPADGATLPWEGRTFTIKRQQPFAPDGTLIFTYLWVAA